MSQTLVIGVREEYFNGVLRQVEDEIGVVNSLIGEEPFGQQFVDLVTAKCGSLQKFQSTYPRLLLNWKS